MDDIGETKVSNGIFGVLTESKSKAVVFPPGVDTLEAFNRDVRFFSKLLGVRMNASGFGVVTFGDFEGDEGVFAGVFLAADFGVFAGVFLAADLLGVLAGVFFSADFGVLAGDFLAADLGVLAGDFFEADLGVLAGDILAADLGVLAGNKVWSLTKFYSVDFSQSRIGVKKCAFNNRTIKVCVSCW